MPNCYSSKFARLFSHLSETRLGIMPPTSKTGASDLTGAPRGRLCVLACAVELARTYSRRIVLLLQVEDNILSFAQFFSFSVLFLEPYDECEFYTLRTRLT